MCNSYLSGCLHERRGGPCGACRTIVVPPGPRRVVADFLCIAARAAGSPRLWRLRGRRYDCAGLIECRPRVASAYWLL